MTIGLVLASSPAYSETFFHSKIKGLNASGYKVILFCSKNSENFKSCQVALLPKRHSNIIILVFNVLWVYFGLIPFLKSDFQNTGTLTTGLGPKPGFLLLSNVSPVALL